MKFCNKCNAENKDSATNAELNLSNFAVVQRKVVNILINIYSLRTQNSVHHVELV